MMEKHARLFGVGVAGITEFKFLCAEFAKSNDVPMNDDLRRLANHVADQLKRVCILSDMDQFVAAIDRFLDSVNDHGGLVRRPASQIALEAKLLLLSLWDYLDNEFYFHIHSADYLIFAEAEPFGPGMPDVLREDISEAAKCLALQRPTACVFHLMRVMEASVKKFGRRLKIPPFEDVTKETWHNVLNRVNQSINALPARTAPQAKVKNGMAMLAGHLNAVRIAWRNEVMHPKQTYTLEEAHEVFSHTKLFMREYVSIIRA